jgi:hypothetical protein
MNIPLAQLAGNPPPPEGFSNWLQSATYLVWLAGGCLVLWRHLKKPAAAAVEVSNNPLTVAPFVSYVEKDDYARDQKIVDDRLTSATESRKAMHEDIERHGQRIASLEKGERHTEMTLASIDQKLTTVLQRLPKN